MAKNKVRIDRVIILILVAILLIGILVFGGIKIYQTFFKNKNVDPKQNPEPVQETVKGVKLTLNNYTVYSDDTGDIGFGFVIADVKFTAQEPVKFELSNLQTSEKVNLSDIAKYINKMELAGYNLKKLNINTTGIDSDEKEVDAKIFVPFNTNADSICVYNSNDTTTRFEFDLTNNPIPATSLKLDNKDTQIEVGTTTVSVTNAYISDFMLHNGEQYEIGSSQKMYTFEITVRQAQENVTITDATFIQKGTSDEIHCMSKEYKSIDMDNILGTNLTVGTKGGLFFDVHSSENVVEDGTLLIKFSNSEKWVEVSTNRD